MNNKYYLASSIEMEKRIRLAEEFYHVILDPEEIPYIVTDEATLYAIYIGDEIEMIKKIKKEYQVEIDLQHFKMPFWKLLDFLEKNKKPIIKE